MEVVDHTGHFFAPLGQTEGAWDPLSLVEGMVHPHSQERARKNHLGEDLPVVQSSV